MPPVWGSLIPSVEGWGSSKQEVPAKAENRAGHLAGMGLWNGFREADNIFFHLTQTKRTASTRMKLERSCFELQPQYQVSDFLCMGLTETQYFIMTIVS